MSINILIRIKLIMKKGDLHQQHLNTMMDIRICISKRQIFSSTMSSNALNKTRRSCQILMKRKKNCGKVFLKVLHLTRLLINNKSCSIFKTLLLRKMKNRVAIRIYITTLDPPSMVKVIKALQEINSLIKKYNHKESNFNPKCLYPMKMKLIS